MTFDIPGYPPAFEYREFSVRPSRLNSAQAGGLFPAQGLALERPDSPFSRKKTQASSWARRAACRFRPISSARFAGCEVLVDFTRPEATLKHLEICASRGIRHGDRDHGITPEQKKLVSAASRDIAIVMAPT